MTYTEAKISDLLATGDRADFLAACKIVNEIDDDAEFASIARLFPLLVCYDAKGNYTGPVANENGWTA